MTNAPIEPNTDDAAERLARLAARRSGRPAAVSATRSATNTPTAKPGGRRHAAKGSRAAALMMSMAATGGLSVVFVHGAAATSSASAPARSTGSPATTGSTTVARASGPVATPATSASASASPSAFTGSAVPNRFGTVQVSITVAGGKIADVQALQLPSGGKSTRINDSASPVLRTETLSTQSSTINVVSGATYTSRGYAQSLQVAIDAAKTAGVLVA